MQYPGALRCAAGLFVAAAWLLPYPAAADGAASPEAGPAASNPYEGNAAAAEAGRSLFNQNCAHCHGPDALSPLRERDLRRLRIRYAGRMAEVFYYTVTHGRPEKGMPNWKGALDDSTFWRIFTFLETVQKAP
jgi:mono/diheme cytochrome c family protein